MMNPKKRLLFFDFITHYGGAQISTVLLCNRLKEQYDVHIVDAYGCCKPYLDGIEANGLQVHVLMPQKKKVVIGYAGRPLMRLLSLLRQLPDFMALTYRLCRVVCRLKPDLIWTNNIKALFFLSICSPLNQSPIGYYAHGWYLKKQISWWQRALIKKFANIIFAVSNPTKAAMIEWGVDEGKIEVVYNTTDVESFLRRAAEKKKLQQKENNEFVIIVPGTLLSTKGQHTAIGAMRILKNKCSPFRFKLCFAGDMGVGDTSGYAESLKAQIQKYELEEDIMFLGWRSDILELMQKADAVVLPTHTEGLPQVVQEAIMLKKPVITTNVGGISDLISDGETGFLIGIEDETALADKILWNAENPGSVRQMVDLAFERYLSIFNSQNQIKLFRQAIDSLLR